jgi:hypothetical protein
VSARAILATALLLMSGTLCLAAPRPNIPSSELPGRERERFIDRFPPPSGAAPAIVIPQQAAPRAKRSCGKKRKRC